MIRADDREGFAAAYDRIGALLRDPEVRRRGGEECRHLLVEDYVPGDEYALEGLLVEGSLRVLALFDKPDPLVGPVFEETIYVTPSRAPAPVQEAIVESVRATAAAVGLTGGPVHAEVRVRSDREAIEAVPVDVAARTIGGRCGRALRFGTGLSLEELVLRHALGDDRYPAREEDAAGVLMLPVPRAGTLRRITGVDEARTIPGIREIEISIPVGREVVPLPQGNRYLGFAFASGFDPGQVEAALRAARDRIRVEIEDMDEGRGSTPPLR